MAEFEKMNIYISLTRGGSMARTRAGRFVRGLSGSIAKTAFIALVVWGFSLTYAAAYTEVAAPIDDRVADLLSKLTFAEKIDLRNKSNKPISRLNMGSVQWWTEMQNGRKTVFPAGIGKACTWDQDLMFAVGKVYGDEARNDYKAMGQQFYSPAVVNLAMDPRAGRNDEGWGEDPYLAGVLAGQLVKGAQGNREIPMPGGTEAYLKIGLMAKHLVGNNHENSRYNDVSVMDERDFREWFMAPFKSLIDADIGGVMVGLNPITVTGIPGVLAIQNTECAYTMDTILRKEWKWKGYITGDCEGVRNHELAMERGLDAECHDGLSGDMPQNIVNVAALDRAVSRLLRLRMRMGEFDPAGVCPYKSQTYDGTANLAISLQSAREAVVLAKNANNILPIDKSVIKKIVLIGPVAAHPASTGTAQQNFFGGYSGWPSNGSVTNLQQGMQAYASANGLTLTYISGMDGDCINGTFGNNTLSAGDQQNIRDAQIVVAAVGTENNDNRAGSNNVPCQLDDLYPGEGRDLTNINLPGAQEAMVRAVYGLNKKVVVVVQDQEVRTAPFAFDSCPGVVISLTGGQYVGKGITDVLFGDFNPSGRVAQTWMRTISDYPDRKNYSIRVAKRTYWYFDKPVFFPFGHGLSYTTFAYANKTKAYGPASSDTVATITFDVQNTGTKAGAEVTQLYVHALNSSIVRPLKELRNFKRVDIATGAKATVSFKVTKRDLAYWNTTNKAFTVDNGNYEILIGSTSADIRLKDTLQVPVSVIIPRFGPNSDGQTASPNSVMAHSKTMKRVFVDSRSGHYSFSPDFLYDVYACNGRKVMQCKGVDVNSYLLHTTRGVYMVMGQKNDSK
jgi:beta-glucosidase